GHGQDAQPVGGRSSQRGQVTLEGAQDLSQEFLPWIGRRWRLDFPNPTAVVSQGSRGPGDAKDGLTLGTAVALAGAIVFQPERHAAQVATERNGHGPDLWRSSGGSLRPLHHAGLRNSS